MTAVTSRQIERPVAAVPIAEPDARASGGRITLLLGLLLLASTFMAGYAGLRLNHAHEAALLAQQDMRASQSELADLAVWRVGRTTGVPLNAQDPELNRRLSAAAQAAGIATELASIEPGSPGRAKDADYTTTPVFIRFGAVTLHELATFLNDLSATDLAVKTKSIELQPPETPSPPGPSSRRPGEMWTCDVALAYLTYAPRGREGR